MSYGILINGRDPKSKKEIREADPNTVTVYGTSYFGDDPHSGKTLAQLLSDPAIRIDFVGPNPYHKRVFYGNVINGKAR